MERAPNLVCLSKMHYIEFGRDPAQNFSKIKQFLLLEVKFPKFPNFGHLFLKESPFFPIFFNTVCQSTSHFLTFKQN